MVENSLMKARYNKKISKNVSFVERRITRFSFVGNSLEITSFAGEEVVRGL